MERTSDITLRIGVRGASGLNTGVGSGADGNASTGVATTPANLTGGLLSDTGAPLYIGLGIASILLIVGITLTVIAKKRQKRWGVTSRRMPSGMMTLAVTAAVSSIAVWNITAIAAPVMDIRSSIAGADISLEADGSQKTFENTVDMAANSSTGYALEAIIASSNLPASGARVAVTGGDASGFAAVSTDSQTRLMTRDQSASHVSVPVTVAASADASVPEGDYEVKLRFTVKALPSSDQATQQPTIFGLMGVQATSGGFVKLNEFTENDQVQNIYKIVDELPNDRVVSRIAVPLANGKYALPQALNTKLPEPNKPQRVNEMLEVAQTYVDAGAQLKWDSGRDTPLQSVQPIHERYTAPYALTCSSFANMVLAAWKYNDTTYVANSNTASYAWGTNFDRPAGTEPPFQAWKLLRWMDWQGRAAVYNPGADDYQPGDLLFFSKQNPEGPGTGGEYYMNVYHVSIYMGNNKVVHSISPDTGNGVVIQDLNQVLKNDLTFVARPNLGQ